jgi:hypothetical protein
MTNIPGAWTRATAKHLIAFHFLLDGDALPGLDGLASRARMCREPLLYTASEGILAC